MFQYDIPKHIHDIVRRIHQFLDETIIPKETEVRMDDRDITEEEVQNLRAAAKAAGLWAPTMPKDLGGMGLSIQEWGPVLEASGRSLLGPLAMHCSAPDEGNMHLLNMFVTDEQRERYLRPLVAGETFSGFAMTEPAPGAGSDPRMIQTRAERDGDEWVINGHKWWTTNGEVADFLIIMAQTDPSVHPYQGCTIFLAPVDTPGIRLVRDIPTIGRKDFGGHAEFRFENLRVPHSAILGEEGEGFALTQHRLGPARLTHCMRWTGIAQRALEIATEYGSEREAFGGPLTSHQSIQWMLADSAMELHAGRLMIQNAAWLLDNGDQARAETSMTKVFVAETVNRVLDRALQICGGLGISRDLPIAGWYEDARAFRIYDGASEVHRMVVGRHVIKQFGVKRDRKAAAD